MIFLIIKRNYILFTGTDTVDGEEYSRLYLISPTTKIVKLIRGSTEPFEKRLHPKQNPLTLDGELSVGIRRRTNPININGIAKYSDNSEFVKSWLINLKTNVAVRRPGKFGSQYTRYHWIQAFVN